jgi:ABC-type transport system involved in multi-copper enzyme maturation permease subunit
MQLSMILAIAGAEIRSVRRLARYWLFAVLSVLATFAIYLYYAAIHGFFSRLSATIGAIGPRYLVPAMGIYIMVIFLLGLVFLAFDVRARDERERMAEVLDARPFSNAELLVGRSLGLVLMAWAPALAVAILFQTFGSLAQAFGWYLGEPVEPYSLLGFLIHALSVFAPWCAAVILIAVLVRNRLVVALAALALVGLQLWSSFRMPLYLQPAFGALFPTAPTTSDLVPSIVGGVGAIRVVAFFVLTGGLLALAAAFHPRRDGAPKSRRLALGGGLLAVAAVLIGVVAWQSVGDVNRRAAWLEAHRARSQDPAPDISAISGIVRIDPGRQLQLDLDMRVAPPAGRTPETLLFTLNPGLTVERVSVGGADATWTHAAGLLEVTPPGPLGAGAVATMELVASGTPDEGFGYLDSEIDLLTDTVTNANLALFGIQAGFFRSRYVALMPAQAWLPRAGAAVPAADPRTHPADPFDIDLEVEVPSDWLVAGPGRRQVVEAGGDVARFRFSPGAPVTQVGLLASRFERRAREIAGVEFEILVHPAHDRNLRFFEDATEEIADRVEALFAEAERLGLPYPYGGLTLVESPTALRGYGGGWRMDTTQTLPGVLLLRENSFPTARFEFQFRNPASFEGLEGGMARAKVDALEGFFENDVSGGNLFLGGSRNFLLFQTGARGEGALALNFVVDDLVNLLLTGKRGFFSPFLFASGFNTAIGQVVVEVVTGQTDSIAQAVVNTTSDRPSVWDRALAVSLADLDPADDAERTLQVLTIKSPAIARSILDGLGRDKTAAVLAELLSRHRGGHFTAEDFRQVALDLDADLEPIVGDWLHESDLPGFMPSPVELERLADDAQGTPRYQTRVQVFNGESTPGLLRIRYALGEEGSAVRWDQTEPVRLGGHEAMEIGVTTSMPPREIWLQPYLSLNRDDMRLALPSVNQQEMVREAPFVGSRPSAWRPPDTGDIVIDDLDPGFSVEEDESASGFRLAATGIFVGEPEIDQGLPAFTAPPGTGVPAEWSRVAAPSGWGKYRRTAVSVRPGSGGRRAIFMATVPQAGRWRLGYYLPIGALPALGRYDLTLRVGGDTRAVEFDGAAAQGGWNTLGEFELPAGEVRLELSDESSGTVVVADAIRWQRVEGAADAR